MSHKCGSGCYRKRGERSQCPTCNRANERRRLRREYDALPKSLHGQQTTSRHPQIKPEWVVQVINNPYDQKEGVTSRGEPAIILAGRVPEYRHWIKVVLLKTTKGPEYHTAYPDRRLNKIFGGGPWQNLLKPPSA